MRTLTLCVLGIVSSSAAARGPADEPDRPTSGQRPRLGGDAGPLVTQAAQLAHAKNLERLRREPHAGPASSDVGDVALIIDDGSVVTGGTGAGDRFDLELAAALDFAPLPGGGYAATRSEASFELGDLGEALPLGDDDTTEVALPFAFPFQGAIYTTLWVNSDGNVSFGRGDAASLARTAARLRAGPPRIAPLLADLDPSSFDTLALVTVASDAKRVRVSWIAPEYGGYLPVFVRLSLFPDGAFRFEYLDVSRDQWSQPLTIGFAPGDGLGPVPAVDLWQAIPGDITTPGLCQEFGFRRDRFDLAFQGIDFVPEAGGFAVLPGDGVLDEDFGDYLPLSDYDSLEVPLDFALPFIGSAYASVFVNSNGNLTLGAGDPFGGPLDFFGAADLGTFLGGPPRIAPFFALLAPESGGAVFASRRADRLVVTWLEVDSPWGPVTAQATLAADGRVSFTYGAVAGRVAFVGVSAGAAGQSMQALDYASELPSFSAAASIYEKFGFRTVPVDVNGRAVTFTPERGGFRVHTELARFDDSVGRPLDLFSGPAEVALGFDFPFFGESYDRAFVNSAGNVTFGSPDSALLDEARFIAGPPRVAVLGTELFFFDTGAVSVTQTPDAATITWTHALAYPTWADVTMQLTLQRDGVIRLGYGATGGPIAGLVGVAAGGGSGLVSRIDISDNLKRGYQAGAIFEAFSLDSFFPRVDVFQLANSFYQSHRDKYDFLVFFTDFPVDLGTGTIAFEVNASNHTQGIAAPLFDISGLFGSGGELESAVMMGNVGLYWPDAERMLDPPLFTMTVGQGRFKDFVFNVPGDTHELRALGLSDGSPAFTLPEHGWHALGLYSPISLLSHEITHRWIVDPLPFVHPETGIGPDSFDLNSGFSAHWTFTLDERVDAGRFADEPRTSAFSGNYLHDLGGPAYDPLTGQSECDLPGEGAFVTDSEQLDDGWTPLDEYLMGLRQADEVGPFYYADDARFPGALPWVTPQMSGAAVRDVFLCGHRVDLDIDAIRAFPGVGPRVPALGDEDDDGQGNDVKTVAFVLLSRGDAPPASRAAALGRVDTFRRTWEAYVNGPATGGRARFDTRLAPTVY